MLHDKAYFICEIKTVWAGSSDGADDSAYVSIWRVVADRQLVLFVSAERSGRLGESLFSDTGW